MWQVRVASFAKSKRPAQRELLRDIRLLTDFTLRPSLSIYDRLGDDDRAILIGDAIDTAGVEWLKEHPRQQQWLMDRGLSVTECVRRSQEHSARAVAFSGFTPARKRNSLRHDQDH